MAEDEAAYWAQMNDKENGFVHSTSGMENNVNVVLPAVAVQKQSREKYLHTCCTIWRRLWLQHFSHLNGISIYNRQLRDFSKLDIALWKLTLVV